MHDELVTGADSGDNAVALEPGVVFTCDRNTQTNTLCAPRCPIARDPVAF